MSKVEKVIVHNVKLRIAAREAAPIPAIASSLGPKGINTAKFCAEFNAKTKDGYELESDTPLKLRVLIQVFSDKSYIIFIKGYSSVEVIKRLLGLKSGSSSPGKELVSSIPHEKLYDVARKVMYSMNTINLEAAVSNVMGTLKSMGVSIVYNNVSKIGDEV